MAYERDLRVPHGPTLFCLFDFKMLHAHFISGPIFVSNYNSICSHGISFWGPLSLRINQLIVIKTSILWGKSTTFYGHNLVFSGAISPIIMGKFYGNLVSFIGHFSKFYGALWGNSCRFLESNSGHLRLS